MTPLILTILSSSCIFVIFKLFTRFKIDTFQAIVFNYFTAFICGSFFSDNGWNNIEFQLGNWGAYAVICSVLFISLFLLMGKSSQINGVARTSVSVKMSMAISVLGMVFFYSESFTLLKIAGVALAFLGVYLVSKDKTEQKTKAIWMLFVLFIGSGLLDFVLNYVQQLKLEEFSNSLFTAVGFLFAGTIGLTLLIFQLILKKRTFHLKNLFAGIILGIPNYFSIYFLLQSYTHLEWNDSTVLAVLNVSIVLLSSIFGFVLFKESANQRKIVGLIASIGAIVCLYLAG